MKTMWLNAITTERMKKNVINNSYYTLLGGTNSSVVFVLPHRL
jgi:hypothetical protein